jgi:hypothetical protein
MTRWLDDQILLRMERETGIEPATNSLEGCDSTTELLPPSRRTASPARRFGGQARLYAATLIYVPAFTAGPANRVRSVSCFSAVGLPTEARPACCFSRRWLANRRSRSERRLVAREGLEPSKPLGRQIYSLLRLTASLPRQLFLLNVSSDAYPAEKLSNGAGGRI